jgi:DNA repair protein RadA/Sms
LKKNKTSFFYQHCGYMSPKWLGKCPSCNGWNCFAEELISDSDSSSRTEMKFDGKPLPIEDISVEEGNRTITGIAEIDRVLGGGIVGGSAILIGGEPGIGKSTLMLQMMHNLAEQGLKVLYVSGEESANQIKMRSGRIGAASKDLLVLVEISLEKILEQINYLKCIIILDFRYFHANQSTGNLT